jgi:hypothetical protein
VDDVDELEEEKVPNVEDEVYVYEYELDTIVITKPPAGDELPFWLGKVVNLGAGDREGEYEIWWMASKKVYGTYHPAMDARRKPVVIGSSRKLYRMRSQ